MKLEEAIKSNRFADEKHKALINLMYTSYWMKTHLSTALKQNGLTIEQFNVLRILKGKYPEQLCVKDIGTRMIEKSSNVPRIVDRLLVKKLVKRVPSTEDKRETMVSLTEKGMKHVAEANDVVNSVQDNIIGLSETDAVLLHELMEKMRRVD